jgi:hypothetical protein
MCSYFSCCYCYCYCFYEQCTNEPAANRDVAGIWSRRPRSSTCTHTHTCARTHTDTGTATTPATPATQQNSRAPVLAAPLWKVTSRSVAQEPHRAIATPRHAAATDDVTQLLMMTPRPSNTFAPARHVSVIRDDRVDILTAEERLPDPNSVSESTCTIAGQHQQPCRHSQGWVATTTILSFTTC